MIEPDSANAIADAVKKLNALDEAERQEMGARGKEFAIREFDYASLAKKLIEKVFKNG